MLLAVEDSLHREMLITLVAAISAGVMLVVVSRRLGLPAIVLLLAGGVLLGPAVWGAEHAIVKPESLGDFLRVIVSLFVGLILFEGGLTLDLTGYRTASGMIKRLLSIGVIITWMGAAAAVWLLFGIKHGWEWRTPLLAGSLVIVTGPTVIGPLLKRIKVNTRLHNILHWEGVLIDPIGVFVALLCYEALVEHGGQAAVLSLFIRIGSGLFIGAAGGLALSFIVRRKWVPEDMVNVVALAFAVLIFGVADAVRSEAGLLAVTVAGFVFGITGGGRLKQVRRFKAEITDLLIGTLFILLASRLEFAQFADFGLRGAIAVLIVMLLVRPLSIFLCGWGVDLKVSEKLFLAWVAPRGIVAASMASLFALNLDRLGTVENPRFVETFTYSVIIATIVIQGLSADPIAKMLGLKRPKPSGWLIVGAHAFGRKIGEFIARIAELPVVMIDNNARAVREAEAEGFTALLADARDTTTLQERQELQVVGNVLALTDNEDLNVRLCQNWAEVVGRDNVYRCNPTTAEPNHDSSEEGTSTGYVVWPKLPKPSLLAAEIQRGEASILQATGHEPAFAQLATPLASFEDNRLTFDPPEREDDESPEDVTTLYLQRRAAYLLRALRPELIVTSEADSLRTLFEELIDRVVKLRPNLPREKTVGELLERETAFPTVLGHGVAVPHAYVAGLDARLCVLARLPKGMSFSGGDSESVHLVFLLLSPQGDPEGHLATLAEVARLVIDVEVRESIINADAPLEVMRIVRQSG